MTIELKTKALDLATDAYLFGVALVAGLVSGSAVYGYAIQDLMQMAAITASAGAFG